MQFEMEKKYRAALRSINGIGSSRLRELIAYFGSAKTAWEASSSKFAEFGKTEWVRRILEQRDIISPDKIINELKEKNISIVISSEPHYPFLLAELPDAPPILYYRGTLVKAEAFAIVGSRRATSYGRTAARNLAKEAALEGLTIVSGLARGIDTAAHEGALAGQGQTWAFLGCGLDHIYPPENRRLAEQIVENGAILSEFTPGTPPEARHFPARNRLISGCSRGVLVIEAALKSGALITVDFALEQGREVFAVPGPIFSENSKGAHHLIRSGAKLVESLEDIKAELPFVFNQKQDYNRTWAMNKNPDPEINVNSDYDKILELLSDLPVHIDNLAINCSLAPGDLALALLELQLKGRVNQLPGQFYVLSRSS